MGYSIVLRLLKSSLDTIAREQPRAAGGRDRNRKGREGAGVMPRLRCVRQQLLELVLMG